MYYLICHLSRAPQVTVTIVKALLKFFSRLTEKNLEASGKFAYGLLTFSSYTVYMAGAGLSSAGFETKMNDLKQFFNRTTKEKK